MKQLARTKLLAKINSAESSTFFIKFTKKNGTVREMNAQKDVQHNLKGRASTVDKDDNGYYTTFDTDIGEYRVVNLETVSRVELDGEVYIVT